MNLEEIETKADELAEKMLATESRTERSHHMWAIEGLHRLAQVKATVAFRKERDADHDLRSREAAAMEQAAADIHAVRRAQVPEPTKPAADRLHELVSYFRMTADNAEEARQHTDSDRLSAKHAGAKKAYDDAATKLQEILNEGGL